MDSTQYEGNAEDADQREGADEAVERLTQRWADLAIEEEEDVGLEPVGNDVGVVAEEEERSWVCVGRFLTSKVIKLEYMRQVMASVWQPVLGMQATEIRPGVFMFIFFDETDMRRVLDEGPWSFDNNTLVFRHVMVGVRPGDVELTSVDMWVQMYDLPVGYTSDVVLEQAANFIGTFVKMDDCFPGAPWKTFHRVRVSIPVDKPLKRRMKLIKRDKTSCWVNFRYERLHTFCFYCGHSALFLNTDTALRGQGGPRGFRFEMAWVQDDGCKEVVEIG
ncbi:PREDICTED: uncharacterized protein LOC109186037 [Ipomoea nil]|uniref:uncharacterized protein LOC109186037 n=1 Tax=Ipomoea nil TaxID=35883 RepID=UPI000900C3C0|nr:PREDICTED: uncharacterized protein LOC109186037 [Ipomoea nil]